MFHRPAKQLVVLSCLTLAAVGTAHAQSASEERSVGAFSRLSVGGGIDVDLTQASTPRVTVEVEGFELDDIVTEVVDGELRISNTERRGFSFFRGGEGDVNVHVDFVTLSAIRASGGSDIRGRNDFELDELEIEASGGSDVELDVVEAQSLAFRVSGGSDVRVSGRTRALDIVASGGSDADADSLQADEVTLSVSGGSDADVWANESLVANASGGSDVTVRGDPAERTVHSGVSSDVRWR